MTIPLAAATATMPARMRVGIKEASAVLDFFPLATLGRLQHRIRDVVRGEAITERRRHALALDRRRGEVGELMDERVLVSDLKAGHPPMLHVGLIAVGDVHVAPAAD